MNEVKIYFLKEIIAEQKKMKQK